MSKLYVNNIYPQSGTDVVVSGNLEVSGTFKAYKFDTIVEGSTTHLGSTSFGNDSADTHSFTGSLHLSGSGFTITGAQAGSATITLKADQADDSADTTTVSVTDGGDFTIDCAGDIVLDADGAEITFKDAGTQYAKFSSATGHELTGALYVSGSVILGSVSDHQLYLSGALTASTDSVILDDKKIYFGTNTDGYIEYNEDGDNFLTISGSAAGLALSGTIVEVATNIKIKDDKKLYFGTNNDAYIEYDEDGTDELILSGAQGGIDIQAPDGVADGLTISAGGAAYVTLDTTSGEQTVTANKELVLAAGGIVNDDQKLVFGSGDDAHIEYNENGDDFLVISGSAAGLALSGTIVEVATNIKIKDDKKLYFGTNNDAYIEYDEDGTDELILSGAQGGIDIQAPDGVADGLTISAGGAAYVTLDTTSGEQIVTANKEFVFAAGAVVEDDQKLVFGSDDESHIEYNENGDNFLSISGSAAGLALSGNVISFDPESVDSGSIAGLGSYLGITSTGQIVLTSSAGGDGSPGGSDTQVQYNNGGSFGGVASLTYNDSTGHLTVIDDKKLYFGTNNDAYIEYDEDDTDELILSGAQGGIDIQAPDGVADGLTISAGGAAYVTLDTTSGEQVVTANKELVLAAGGIINDDQKLVFGTDDESHIEYNENGDNFLTISGSAAGLALSGTIVEVATNIKIKDDKKLYFGDGSDAYIEYNEDGDNYLTISGSVSGLVLSGGAVEIATSMIMADDKKLYFGTDDDAYIEYDEDGTNELIISGAQGGIDIKVPEGVSDSLTISAGASAYMTFDTTADEETVNMNKEVTIVSGLLVKDDQKIVFGNDDDAHIEYDENGDNYLIISGSATGLALSGGIINLESDTLIKDNKKFYFGNDDDASIHYSATTDHLVISGAHEIGTVISGSAVELSNNTNLVFGRPSLLANDTGCGEMVYFGTGSGPLVAGALYFLNETGGWSSASADATGSGNNALLGLALGGDPADDGLLTRGYFDVHTYFSGAYVTGSTMYVCSTADGYITDFAPTGGDNYVRAVGHAITTSKVIYFNPSCDWVEISGD